MYVGVGWVSQSYHLCGTPQVWVPRRNETQNIYSFTKHLLSNFYVPGTGHGAEDRTLSKTRLPPLAEIPPS